MTCKKIGDGICVGPEDEEVTEVLYDTFDGPYGKIEIYAVKEDPNKPSALDKLHRTIAEIMVKQARKNALELHQQKEE
ncbi:hypothetical protein [Paenibacillus sp. USDA918EY]|uniref:hypothetical protein n=1 Tax=Paenibacillus sp. USDA918EY TaxID=2689575 RepID=UPI00135CA97B|nr:hypothetical protein [Paenibacillus sp. USDA918EY]